MAEKETGSDTFELVPTHIQFNQAPQGSTIEPLYTARKMRAFSVTESELNMLSVINGIAGVCAAIATGLLGLSVDIQKDIMLSTSLPETADSLRDVARPLLFWLAMAFYGFGAIALAWRHNTLGIIKRETGGGAQRGWGVSLWPPRLWRLEE